MLEQFKSSLPAQLAYYIDERKVTTASAAAVLNDEYVLTHASGKVFGQVHREGTMIMFTLALVYVSSL